MALNCTKRRYEPQLLQAATREKHNRDKTSSVYGCNEGLYGCHFKGLADCGNICHLSLEEKIQKNKIGKVYVDMSLK